MGPGGPPATSPAHRQACAGVRSSRRRASCPIPERSYAPKPVPGVQPDRTSVDSTTKISKENLETPNWVVWGALVNYLSSTAQNFLEGVLTFFNAHRRPVDRRAGIPACRAGKAETIGFSRCIGRPTRRAVSAARGRDCCRPEWLGDVDTAPLACRHSPYVRSRGYTPNSVRLPVCIQGSSMTANSSRPPRLNEMSHRLALTYRPW